MFKGRSSDVSFFQNETYHCSCSDNDLSREEAIEMGWFCSECDEYIHIHAEDKDKQAVFIRMQAKDIVKNVLICPDGMNIDTYYIVLGINELTSKKYIGKLGIGLKNYRQIIVKPDYIINCRIGGSW